MTRPPHVDRPRAGRDPGRPRPAAVPLAAILSVIGLLVVAVATLAVGSGQLPFGSRTNTGANGPGASDDPTVIRTPTPSNVIVVPTEAPGLEVPGTIVYVKDGNVWLQSGGQATQLTSGGRDSMPSFSPDGSSVYFVRTRKMDGAWSVDGVIRNYHLDVPSLLRIPTAGGDTTRIFDGLVDPPGRQKWMGFMREPVLSPDGTTFALATDLPDPTHSDVTLKLLNAKTGKITDLGLDQVPPLGHQDPAWRPDGKQVAYVRADRDGAKGTPRIYLYTLATKKTKSITGPGYLHPAWSPDGRYLAATRTSAIGTDVVILDPANGAELLRLSNDGDSWAPAWSPAGNQIVFLHVSGQVVDLRLVQLEGSAPSWTMDDPVDLTTNAGLEGVSRPDWFVPPDQLPAPTAPAASPSGS